MEQLCRGLEALRRNPRGGMSMIVAVCAGVLLLGLTASLLYSASLPLARANRKIGQERCRQLSASFAQVLDGELRRYVTDKAEVDRASGEEYAPPDSDAFYSYANKVMEGIYGEYDPNDPNSVLHYSLSDGAENDENYGKLTVRLRKTTLEDPAQNLAGQEEFGRFSYGDKDKGADTAEQTQFVRYQFTVEAAVELDNDSSSTATEYYRKDSFQPLYTWHTINAPAEVNLPDVPVYWNGSSFYKDSSFHDKMEFQSVKIIVSDGDELREEIWTEGPENVSISYKYDTDETTYKRYTPVYEERNAPAGGGEGGDVP